MNFSPQILYGYCQSGVKEGPPFHAFLQVFNKNFKILVLSHNFSHFVTNFLEDLQKIFPDIRNLLFLCNKELRKNFTPILTVCQR